jgi:hypothetical protein
MKNLKAQKKTQVKTVKSSQIEGWLTSFVVSYEGTGIELIP